ncbi:hypothetical protein O0I10_004584 [Lichtheimia ornata]|uniref:Vhs domain-containing protein n=1 Tax=Lichtheimia ornata TaxID=688661 RepID=A0AAD7V697_9FUNG|nr:uncharacterized protein O0I10_004584 [Lichtheimia ornata]KAJ8659605.1 hypothetical protein O0I10_004584 [Lichtheimia ornata]
MAGPIVEFIEEACSVARYEPDLALNLEICEMINKKQGNAPREAATAIVRLVNSRNLNQSMLALTLLDNCVKNCGYPFHLQVATKEFLNELVRKFPERPAPFPNPAIQRILYMIKEWKVALADMSRHKDDLIHIKDMYRLLRFKGYRFPELKDASVAALAPSQSLKSAEELEEEDRVAQSAKLQELIRRGRPQDLVEANQLMKVMTGYDQRQKPNYQQKFEEELHKIQEKVILLYEMLENVKPGEQINRNETLVELRNSSAGAQPKIQKMIQEEEDTEKIENLLTLNDMINNSMAKFADIQKGIYDTQYEISGKPPKQTDEAEAPRQAISLIDLDDEPSTGQQAPASTTSKGNVLDELSDIFGQSASISPPQQQQQQQQQPAQQQSLDPLAFLSSNPPATSSSPSPFGLQALPPPPAVSPTLSSSSLGTPSASGSIREQPFNTSQENVADNASSNAIKHEPIELTNKNGLQITLDIVQLDTIWRMKAYFSNQSTAPMENMMLRLAAPRSMQLKMEAQSSDMVPPKSTKSVMQNIILSNPNKEPLRLRYKVTYQQFGVDMEQSGDYHA